jgi:hypothetical protein
MHKSIFLAMLCLMAAIGIVAVPSFSCGDETSRDGQQITRQNLPPWSAQPLKASQVPKVYLSEWKKAENHNKCAPLALLNAEKARGLKVRRATFSGGWAVAYDSPTVRSSFGIAGSGIDIDEPGTVFKFPHVIRWSDGSIVSYGLEGGRGPGYLAYLNVAGQSCLYNIWSKRGREHLESLIETLRLVKTPAAPRAR